MTKYELSLAPNYVPEWGVVEAARELFQNAIDQETVDPSNKMFWEYDEETLQLSIGNKKSVLDTSSLLLGATTKEDDPDTIGQYGEGYKIAALVLTRLDKKLNIYNYKKREVWTARFSNSRKYNSQILVFDVVKKMPWTNVPDNDLTITVDNITKEDFTAIFDSNLHMQPNYEHWHTENGDVLLDSAMQNRIFVNGLFVTEAEDFAYGYSLNAKDISLDRDRGLIKEFDLQWVTSRIWQSFGDEDLNQDAVDAAAAMVVASSPDVKYLRHTSFSVNKSQYNSIAQTAHQSFKNKYGLKAVPVSCQEEAERVPSTHKAIVVEESFKEVIKSSPDYIGVEPVEEPSYAQRLRKWFDQYGLQIERSSAYDLLENIIEDMEANE